MAIGPRAHYAHGSLCSPTQTDVLVPEALFHYQLSRGRVRPYLGGGAGLALINLLDRTINGVITAGAGLRADLTPEWGARLEVDIRLFGDFEVSGLEPGYSASLLGGMPTTSPSPGD